MNVSEKERHLLLVSFPNRSDSMLEEKYSKDACDKIAKFFAIKNNLKLVPGYIWPTRVGHKIFIEINFSTITQDRKVVFTIVEEC